jgi:hypothetical protein
LHESHRAIAIEVPKNQNNNNSCAVTVDFPFENIYCITTGILFEVLVLITMTTI